MKMKSAVAALLLGTSSLVWFDAAIAADFDVEVEGSPYTASSTLNVDKVYFGNLVGGTSFTDSGYAMNSNGEARVGSDASSDGNLVTFTGDGADWLAQGHLSVGYAGSENDMSILDGATVDMRINASFFDLSLGKLDGSNDNTLTVSGAGSALNLGGDDSLSSGGTIYVGRSGTGNTFTIDDGATVVSKQARIGGGTDSNGVATGNSAVVDGDGSTWTLYGTLRVGSGTSSNSSANNLTVSDGGEVAAYKTVHLGFDASSDDNTVLVTGKDSKLSAGVGTNVYADGVNIGAAIGSTGNKVTVTDSGELDVTGKLYIRADNKIVLSDNAKVTADVFTMDADSHYDLEVDAGNPISFDVTNTATLNGTLTTTYTGSLNKLYNVLTAGTISGTFADLDATALNRGFSASVGYTATEANLDLVAHLGEGDVLGKNQRNVANGLNAAFNAGTTLGSDFVDVYDLEGQALQSTLNLMSGESNVYGMTSGVWNADNQLRSALRANSLSGVAGGWAGILGSSSTADEDIGGGTNGSDLHYSGLAGGVSFAASDVFTAGIAVSGGQSSWTTGDIGSGDIDTTQVGGFAKLDFGQGYILATGVMGQHSLAASRSSAMVDEGFGLSSDLKSSSVEIEAGYEITLTEGVTLAPYASFAMNQSKLNDAVSESGTGSAVFALDYAEQTTETRAKSIGMRLSGKVGANASFFTDVSLTDSSADGMTAAFADVSGSDFTVNGADATDPQLNGTIGGLVQLGETSVASFSLGGTFLSGAEDLNGGLGFRYNW